MAQSVTSSQLSLRMYVCKSVIVCARVLTTGYAEDISWCVIRPHSVDYSMTLGVGYINNI